jgi:ABC-2 type transport system ATP-binding protein
MRESADLELRRCYGSAAMMDATFSRDPVGADGASVSLVSVLGLGKRFSKFVALEALDFDLHAGEVVGLLGPNGAGKTTTLKLLLGLLRPSAGSARILGFDCTHDSQRVKERIGFTPDEPQFYDCLTGKETLDFVIGTRGLDPIAAWAHLEESIALFDFGAQLGALTSSYSHGTKKKLSLLCALVHRPRVLLLDEPTNGLDPPTALRVRVLLRREAESGAAVLLSTHLLDMADRMCDRLLVLDRGRRIGAGTGGELRMQAGLAANASLEEAFLGLVGS